MIKSLVVCDLFFTVKGISVMYCAVRLAYSDLNSMAQRLIFLFDGSHPVV